jgi:hypothetical protein
LLAGKADLLVVVARRFQDLKQAVNDFMDVIGSRNTSCLVEARFHAEERRRKGVDAGPAGVNSAHGAAH